MEKDQEGGTRRAGVTMDVLERRADDEGMRNADDTAGLSGRSWDTRGRLRIGGDVAMDKQARIRGNMR